MKAPAVSCKILCAATAVCCVLCLRADAVTFTPLGDLPGGLFRSSVAAVSGDGQVVVGSSWSDRGREAFRWTQGTGMVSLGEVPGTTPPFDNSATAASFDGSVVVGNSSAGAFRWTEETGMAALPAIRSNPAHNGLTARDVSADGNTIVGVADIRPFDHRPTAFRWDQAEGFVNLEFPEDSYWDSSGVTVVSPDGSTMHGTFFASGAADFPFHWDALNGFHVFWDPPIYLGYTSRIYDASADGTIFVGTGGAVREAQTYNAAYRWTAERGFEYLLDVIETPGIAGDEAHGISADGRMIVGSITSPVMPGGGVFPKPEQTIPAIWDEAHGWRSIRQILLDSGVGIAGWTLLAGTTLTRITDISDDGRYVVGTGINPDGNTEGWLVDLANPALLPGDYNASHMVEQGDLDLVLLNWGAKSTLFDPPAGWRRNLPNGIVDQQELDAVLLNWGSTQPAASHFTAVPEPRSFTLLIATVCIAAIWRKTKSQLA